MKRGDTEPPRPNKKSHSELEYNKIMKDFVIEQDNYVIE